MAAMNKTNIYIPLTVYSPLMSTMRIECISCLAAGLAVLLVLAAGCTSGQSGQALASTGNTTKVADVGIVPVTSTNEGPQETVTLDDAAAAIVGYEAGQRNNSQQSPAFSYIRGEQINASGQAKRWIFGINQGNGTVMLVYDKNGIQKITFDQNVAPGSEINLAGIMSPGAAIKIADPSAESGTGPFDLEIVNGEYLITGPAGMQSRTYIINATTGVLSAN
jgi:hypothetical protein